MDELNTIRGHSCDGVVAQNVEEDNANPSINEDGYIWCFEGMNEAFIKFCPWCGEPLMDRAEWETLMKEKYG